ncbi:MAG: hypothetical protein HY722_13405 [Planctomycetes bacterium]|nr:hypothetical protein [Planctomycetota bacterium]
MTDAGWEEAVSRWWDAALREPSAMAAMGQVLGAACALKERGDRALEQAWAAWRLPSAADVERVHERLESLEGRLARLEGGATPGGADRD